MMDLKLDSCLRGNDRLKTGFPLRWNDGLKTGFLPTREWRT